jgi:tetratricopeptide (TPR) repeat protein
MGYKLINQEDRQSNPLVLFAGLLAWRLRGEKTMNKILTSICLLLLAAGTAGAGTCQKGDCQGGWGVYRWDDGSTFIGSFVNGNPDGEGKYTDQTGHKYHVLYVDGEPVTTSPVTDEDEALELRQREAEKYNAAGLIYLERKDYESAIFFFNKAITLWPNNSAYHQNYLRAKGKNP